MTIVKCTPTNRPLVNQYAFTTTGYIIRLKGHAIPYHIDTPEYYYNYVSPYPYDLQRTTISADYIDSFTKETDITIDNIKQAFPEYFI